MLSQLIITAFAASFATVVAGSPLALPEAFALALANPQLPGTTVQCHEACGNTILEWRACGGDSTDTTKE